VQRFVDAFGDRLVSLSLRDNAKATNDQESNPEMNDEQIAFRRAAEGIGVVDSGDTFKLGIGAMTDER